ncbi:hypothetical protein Tco_0573192 [Tanacetum coccineum]
MDLSHSFVPLNYECEGLVRDIVFDIQPVIAASYTIVEDVAPLQPMRQKKRKTVAVDASGPSHPPKKLREDYGDPSGPSIAGKPKSSIQRLLAGAVLNAKVRGEPIPTLPFVTSFVFATPERENKNPANSMTGPNLRTISAPQRFIISSDSSHHSSANIAEVEVDSIVRSPTPIIATVMITTVDAAATAKETPVKPSLFVAGSPQLAGLTLLQVASQMFLWSVTNGSRLDDGRVCHEMLDEFAPPKFFASIRGMEHDQLFTEFNVGAASQVSLSAEWMSFSKHPGNDAVCYTKPLDSLKNWNDHFFWVDSFACPASFPWNTSKGVSKDPFPKSFEFNTEHYAILVAHPAPFLCLVGIIRYYTLDVDTYPEFLRDGDKGRCMLWKLHALMRMVGDKLAKLKVDLSEMALHFKEKFYPHLLITIAGRRWLLTHGLKLFLTKCLNSSEYLSALGAAISRAIEKGMQDGFAAGIEHRAHDRSLEDLVAYNPSVEEDYNAALQELR